MQLLADDPSLKRFKSHKRNVWRLKRVGDVLTIIVVAGMRVSKLQIEKTGLGVLLSKLLYEN